MVIKNFLTLYSTVLQIERGARCLHLTFGVVSSKPAHGIWNIAGKSLVETMQDSQDPCENDDSSQSTLSDSESSLSEDLVEIEDGDQELILVAVARCEVGPVDRLRRCPVL